MKDAWEFMRGTPEERWAYAQVLAGQEEEPVMVGLVVADGTSSKGGAVIRQRNGKYLVLSGIGKVLGKHETLAEAKAQLTAIELSKARKAGHDIPLPKPHK